MCSRFELNSTPREIAARFDLFEMPALPNRQEFRPTDRILIVDAPGKSSLRAWGLPAPWDGSPIFNARSETVTEKPTFQPYLEHRCLIPASAWFEWRKDGKMKQKMRIETTGEKQQPFAFAGLCGEDHATILTTAAIPSLAEIHGRMPLVLTREEAKTWLSPEQTTAELRDMMHPHDVGHLAGTPEAPDASPAAPPAQPDLFS